MADAFLTRTRARLLNGGPRSFFDNLKGLRISVTASILARLWLRRCNKVGPGTKTFGRPHIENSGQMLIGKAVRLTSTWVPLELVTGPAGVLEIGDGAFLNYGTLVSALGRVRIGANTMIGNYSIISDTEIPGIGEPVGAPIGDIRPVEIGEGAWLAARVTVLPGARIGAHAVIAAGSIVCGDIPAGAVAGGIPARVLRYTTPEVEDPIRHEAAVAESRRR